jgi:hypothetical protein
MSASIPIDLHVASSDPLRREESMNLVEFNGYKGQMLGKIGILGG